MVAVIAGAGLGVFNSNVTTGAGVSGQAELGQARERVYVNAATGNLVLQNTDEQVMGLGLGFSLLRTYNSQANFDGDNNDQWRLGFISTVSQDGADYLRTTADGFIQRFKPSGVGGEYISFEGQGHADKLVVKAGNKIEIRSDGDVTETYTEGKLTSRKTPQGEVTVTYSGSKPVDIRLTVLHANQTATTTETLAINYYPDTDPAAGLLRSLSVKDERNVIQNRVEYLYDSEKRLQSVVIDKTSQLTTDSNNVALNKDGNKFVIEYGYVGTSKQINLVRQYQASNKDSTNDNKTELAITYYDANEPAYRAGRVKTLTQGMYLTTYDYLDDNRTRVVQGGQSVDYEFDPQDRLVKVSYDLKGGVSTTSYRYNTNGQLETVTDGLGQKTEYVYDANGNVRQISAPGQPTIIRTYNSNNKLLTEQRGSAVTRYVYDNSGQLLRFAIAADGGVSEYRYNNFKQMIQQRIYHDKEYNISALGATQVPQLGDLESWVADLADKSAQQLTEFSYDVRGQVKTKTQYASVNNSGGGEGTASVWSYLYDLRGQLLQETKPKGYGTASLYDETVTYAYDGLGRLLTSVDAQSNSTTIVNADHNRTQQIRLNNGRYELLTFDKSGQLVSKVVHDERTNKALGTERFYYDDAGRQTAQHDQHNQWTYRFYEENGALAAEVDRAGFVTRYYYDKSQRLERTVQFNDPVNRNNWMLNNKLQYTLGQLDSVLDPRLDLKSGRRENRIIYQNNLKQYEVDAGGYVTAYEYDNESRLQQKRLYVKAVNDPLAAQPLTGFDFNGALASSESYGYDSAGRLETLTNGENYRTQHYYDKAGRKIATRQYANQVVSNRVEESDNDLLEHWRYDGQGRVIAHVAADGAVSRFEYNLNGQVERSIQYAQVVRSLRIAATLSWPTGESRVTSNSYDGNGRLIEQTLPDGQATFYRYDAVGNVTEKWQGKATINVASMTDILRTDFSSEHPLISKGVSAGATDQVYLESGRMVMSRQTSMLPANRTEHYTSLGLNNTLQGSFAENRELQFDFSVSEASKNYFLPYFYYRGWGQSEHTRLGLSINHDSVRFYKHYDGKDEITHITKLEPSKTYRVKMLTSANGVQVILLGLDQQGVETELGRRLLEVPASTRDYKYQFQFESNTRATGFTNKVYIDNFVLRKPELPALVDTNQLHTVERYQYDANGNRIALLDASANAGLGANATEAQVNAAFNNNASARHIYNLRGELTQSFDAEGGRTLYYYDSAGRLTVKIDPERQFTKYYYNSFNEVTSIVQPVKPLSEAQYSSLLTHENGVHKGMDWANNPIDLVAKSYLSSDPLIAVNKSPDDVWQSIGRDNRGLEASSYRDLNLWTSSHNDVTGRTVSAYNILGQLSKQTLNQRYVDGSWTLKSASLDTVFNYDKRGLADTVIRNGVVLSDSDYDAFGRVTLQKAPAKANIETSYQLSAADRQNNQLGRVITTSQTLNQGSAQQQLRQDIIRYDAFGRVLETQDALGTVTRYQYDDTSRSFTVTNSKTGISTETRRNLLGRVSEVVIKQGGTVLQTSRYEYDANGNLLESFLNGVLQESRTYNKNNQLRFVTDATGSRSETAYDKNGRVVKTVVDVDGLKLTTDWDFSAGRSEVKQTEGSRVSWTGYDKNGRVKYLDRLEVVDGVSYRVRTSYSYDQAGQKIEVVNGQRFTVDANQKVTGDADNSAAQTQKFDYDLLGRLVRQYTVLGSGRVNEVQYSYNDADQLIEKKELLSATQQKRTFYSYNQAGEVQAEAVSHSELDGKLRVSLQKFDYDAKGRRIASHQYLSLLNTDKAPTAAISASEMTALIGNAAGPVASSYVAYDAQDRVVARINPIGSRSFTRYDGLGRVTETFTSGLIRTLSNEDLAQLKAGNFGYGDAIYSGLGDARTSYVYDDQNRIAYQLVSTGSQAMVTGYRYDAEGKLSQTRQFATLADYAANPAKGKLDSLATSNEDRVSQQFYDSADRLRYVIDSSGLVTQYTYNVHGQRLSETRHADLIGTKGALATSWQQGSLSYADLQTVYPDSAIAPGSRQISTEYDLLGRVSKITYPAANNQSAAQSERFKYNAAGLQTQKTDQAGNDWVTKYDQAGRMEVQEAPEQLSERYTYNLAGQKATYTDRNGKVWQYQYDLAGRLQAEFTPLLTADDKVQVQLSNGEYVQATGYGKKHYQYDAQGNLTELTEGMVRQLTDTAFYQESRNGNLLNSQVRTTSFAYDVAGRQTRVTQPVAENAPTTYTETGYDALGRAIRSTLYSDGTAVKTEHKVYDAAGRVRFDVLATLNTNGDVTQPSKGFVTEYQYNSFGQQNKLVRYNGEQILTLAGLALGTWTLPADPANRTIETKYDSAGRKWKVLEDSRAYSYWQAGALLNHTDRPETVFEYNSFGEVWKTSVKATPTEWLHSYNWYDNLGRQTHTLDAAGYLSRRSYNSLGEVETYTEYARAIATTNLSQQTPPALPVAGDQQTGADRSWSYGYDKLGRRISETQSGTLYYQSADHGTVQNTITTTRRYDGKNQLVELTDAKGTKKLAYNSIGQLVQSTDGSASTILGDVKRLSAANTLAQQYVQHNAVSQFAYDVFGNMTVSRALAGTGADDSKDTLTYFSYNSRDQVTVQKQVLGAGRSKVTRFSYDAANQLLEQSVSYTEAGARQDMVAGFTNTRYVFDEYNSNEKNDNLKSQTASISSPDSALVVDLKAATITGIPQRSQTFDDLKIQIVKQDGSVADFVVRHAGQLTNEMVRLVAGQAANLVIVGYSNNDAPVSRMYSTTYAYALNGKPSKVTVAGTPVNGGVIGTESEKEIIYNSFGEVIEQYGLNSQQQRGLQNRHVYNTSGLLSFTNEKDGAITELQYDLAGRLVSSYNPLTGSSLYQTDALGRQTQVFQQGQTTDEKYDTKQKYQTQQYFDRWGNVTALTDAMGYSYRYQYNQQNKIVAEFKPESTVVHADGSAERKEAASYFRYDANGQVLLKTDANGGQQKSYYDNNGKLLSTVDAEGNRTYFGYDAMGRLVAQQDATGLIETTQYNQLGLATEVGRVFRRENAQVSGELFQYETKNKYDYNDAGQRIRSTDALGQQQVYRYNARDQLVMSLSPALLQKGYSYDAQGVKISESYQLYAKPEIKTNTWQTNTTGQVTQLTDLGDNQTVYRYQQVDGLSADGRKTGIVSSHRLQEMTVSGSPERAGKLTYEYYANGWLQKVTHSNGNSSSYEYNRNGQRIKETHHSFSSSAGWLTQQVFTNYDEQGRVRKVEVRDGSDTILSKITYRYDAVGNRRNMTVQNGLQGVIDPVSVDTSAGEVRVDVKSGGEFVSRKVAIDELFNTDEADQLQLELGANAPEWLALQYDKISGSLTFINKPGSKAPQFNNFQSFTLTVTARSLLNSNVTATKQLTVRLLPERLMLSPDLALDSDVKSGQTAYLTNENLLIRNYKAGVHDYQNPDTVRPGFVSIALLDRYLATTETRMVKDYFVDPYGGKVTIDVPALQQELAEKAPFLTVLQTTERSGLRIVSKSPADLPGQVVLQSGTFNIQLRVLDSKGAAQIFTLRLVIDPVAPTAPVVPDVGSVVYLGEQQSWSRQLKSAAEPNKALTYHLTSGALPKGLTLTPSGLLSGVIDKDALVGSGDQWNSKQFVVEFVAKQGDLTSAATKLVFEIRNTPTAWASQNKTLPQIKTLANKPVKVSLQEFLRAPDGNRVRLKTIPEGATYNESNYELTVSPLTTSKTFWLALEDGKNGSGHEVAPQKLQVDVVTQLPVFASDITLDQDSNNGQTIVDFANSMIIRKYKATVYDPADTDKTRYSYVSIPLLNRAAVSSDNRLVKDYFVDPYGGQLRINKDKLRAELAKPQYQLNGTPFLWLSDLPEDQDRVRIASIPGGMQNGQVVLKAGQYDIPIELTDSQNNIHVVTLRLLIDANAAPQLNTELSQDTQVINGQTVVDYDNRIITRFYTATTYYHWDQTRPKDRAPNVSIPLLNRVNLSDPTAVVKEYFVDPEGRALTIDLAHLKTQLAAHSPWLWLDESNPASPRIRSVAAGDRPDEVVLKAGDYNFDIRVKDADGLTQSFTLKLVIEAGAPAKPATDGQQQVFNLGEQQSVDLMFRSQVGSDGPVTYHRVGALPEGLTLTADGRLSGTVSRDAVAGSGSHWNSQTFTVEVYATQNGIRSQSTVLTFNIRNTPTVWQDKPALRNHQAVIGQPWILDLNQYLRATDGNDVKLLAHTPGLTLVKDANRHQLVWTPVAGVTSFDYSLTIGDAPNADGSNGHAIQTITGRINVQNRAPQLNTELSQDTQVVNGQTVVDYTNRIITRYYTATDFFSWDQTRPKDRAPNVSIPLLNREILSNATTVVKDYFVDPEGRALTIDLAHLKTQLDEYKQWLWLDESNPASPRIRSKAAGDVPNEVVLRSGTYNFTVRVTDADMVSQTFTIRLVIDKAPPAAPIAPLHPQYPASQAMAFNSGSFIEGKPYDFNLIKSEDPQNKISRFEIVGAGRLPDGLTLDVVTGRISGTIAAGYVGGTVAANHYDTRRADVKIVAHNSTGSSRELLLSFHVYNKPQEWQDKASLRPQTAKVYPGTRFELPLTDSYRAAADGRRVSLQSVGHPLQYDSSRNVLYFDVPANTAVGTTYYYSFVMGGAPQIGLDKLAQDITVSGSFRVEAMPNQAPRISSRITEETDYQTYHTQLSNNTIVRYFSKNGTTFTGPGLTPANPYLYGRVSIPILGRGDRYDAPTGRQIREYLTDPDGAVDDLRIDTSRLAQDLFHPMLGNHRSWLQLGLGDASLVTTINDLYKAEVAFYEKDKPINYVRIRQRDDVAVPSRVSNMVFTIGVRDKKGDTTTAAYSEFKLQLVFRDNSAASTGSSTLLNYNRYVLLNPVTVDELDNLKMGSLQEFRLSSTADDTTEVGPLDISENQLGTQVTLSADPTSLLLDTPLVQPDQFNQAVVAKSLNLQNTPAPASAVTKANIQSYWYTYDRNNRVVIDGGNINRQTNLVDINQQGRWIQYNQLGQQSHVVSTKPGGYSAQRFVYDNKNQLVAIEQAAAKIQASAPSYYEHASFRLNESLNDFIEGSAIKRIRQDLDWRFSQKFSYDELGRVVETINFSSTSAMLALVEPETGGGNQGPTPITKNPDDSTYRERRDVYIDLRGTVESRQSTRYNRDGQITISKTEQISKEADRLTVDLFRPAVESSVLDHGDIYRPDHLTEASLNVLAQQTTYSDFNEVGQAKHFTVHDLSDGKTYNYRRDFELRETVLEKGITGTGTTTGSGKMGTSQSRSSYDIHGNRIRVDEVNDTDKLLRAREMVYAADGTLLHKRDVTKEKANLGDSLLGSKLQAMSHHISSNGQYLGEVSKKLHYRSNGDTTASSSSFSSTVREQHFSSVTGESMAQHVVRRGDSLRTLAQVYYGNADYWYLIANANGLAAEAETGLLLTEGMTLDIPARASSFNSHHNFKPADLAKIIGDTTPTVPYIPPPPKKGCNAVAMVVMIAITAVVTGGVGLAMSSTFGAGAFVAAGVGAFAGSVAGQLAGKAMGVVDSFSLKNAFSSGLTAAATAGFGSYLKGADWAKNADLVNKADELSTYGKMAVAASGVGFSVAANKLAGNRASFQWRNVVSSAVTAGLMARAQLHNITDPLERFSQSGGFLTDFTNGLAGAAIGYGVSKGLYNEGSWNFKNVAQDAFGNAIGNSIVKGLSSERTLSAKEQAELDQKVAAVGRKELAKLDAKTRLQLQQSTDAIATDVGTRLASDSAAGFDALTDVLQQRNDAMMDQYRNKRAEAAAKNGGMWQQTKADIAAIDTTVAANKQQRAVQAAQIQQRYANRAIDFRMANPAYRRPEPLFSYDSALSADNAMWGAGKQRSADLNQLRQNIMNGPTGPSNAIETELNLSLNVPIVELGGGLGFTVDSYGRITVAGDGLFSTTTNLSLSLNAQLSNVKGYGASSRDLGTGYSVSTSFDVTLTDKIFDFSDRIKDKGPISKIAKTFLKSKPADFYFGHEEGWTQTAMPWDRGAENQYRFEGGYVGFAAGWKDVYKIDKSTIKNSQILNFVDKHLTLGKTYEVAGNIYSYDKPNVAGRIIYQALDLFKN